MCLSAFLLFSCNDAEYSPYENSLYIAESFGGNEKTLLVDSLGGEASLTIRTAQVIVEDLTVNIDVNQEALDRFNQKNNTSYKMLPAEYYAVSDSQVKIPSGTVSSNLVDIKVDANTLDILEKEDTYAIAVTIVSTTASNIHLLDNMKTCVFVCKKSKTENPN